MTKSSSEGQTKGIGNDPPSNSHPHRGGRTVGRATINSNLEELEKAVRDKMAGSEQTSPSRHGGRNSVGRATISSNLEQLESAIHDKMAGNEIISPITSNDPRFQRDNGGSTGGFRTRIALEDLDDSSLLVEADKDNASRIQRELEALSNSLTGGSERKLLNEPSEHTDRENRPNDGRLQGEDLEFGVYGTPQCDTNGLIVATPVADNGNETPLPTSFGVEYDPDAKPPVYRTRAFQVYSCLAFCVLILAAVAVTFGIILSKETTYTVNVNPRDGLGITPFVERLVGTEVLLDSSSAYTRALRWIKYEDPLKLTTTDPGFLQRYILAYMYYATSVDHPWDSCNPPSGDEDFTCLFRRLMGIDPEHRVDVPWTRWLSEATECQWAGVFCDSAHQIRRIELAGSNMSGSFPTGIRHLPLLQSFSFTLGRLRGPLPSDIFADMKHLVNIALDYNEFTGPIPQQWVNSRNLLSIFIGDNQITGPLPQGISNLKDLKGMHLSDNGLTGPLPTELGELKGLANLRLQRNLFTGTLPTELGVMSSTATFWLHANNLEGTIPSEIGQLEYLLEIRTSLNPLLSGTIPEELYEKTNMNVLNLDGCNFTGTLSRKVGKWPHLNTLHLSDNHFFGEIPTHLGTLTSLGSVWLQGNDFVGEMPQKLCTRPTLWDLIADCTPDIETNLAEVQCGDDCCSSCCNADGGQCQKTDGT